MSPVCFVTQVLSTLRGSAPDRAAQGFPQSSALRLCRPSLRFVLSTPASPLLLGWEIPLPLRLATPAFARWRSACTCRVSTRTCKSQTQGEDTMNSAAATNPRSQDKPQPKTAKEVIAANVQSLIEQLEAGHSDALTAYLNAMSRFYNYSFGNILEIARQRPDATRVAGLYASNQMGRKVKKGEKGIRILAPIVGVKRKKDEEAEKDITKQNTRVLVGFRNAYVFDVSQTEGAELPALREMSGEVGENRARLISFINRQNIELVFTENIAPALGMSYGGRIAILPGQSEAEEFSTLVHELAHEMLHKAERRTTTTKVVKETEAEAIAFVVGKAVGFNTGTASADYIQLYHGNASLLAESLEVIQQTSAVILAALQPSGTETMPDAELAQVA